MWLVNELFAANSRNFYQLYIEPDQFGADSSSSYTAPGKTWIQGGGKAYANNQGGIRRFQPVFFGMFLANNLRTNICGEISIIRLAGELPLWKLWFISRTILKILYCRNSRFFSYTVEL